MCCHNKDVQLWLFFFGEVYIFNNLHTIFFIKLVLNTKNSEYNTLHTETPFYTLPSHLHQYSCLFTSGPRIMSTLLEIITGDNLHALTVLPPFSFHFCRV